MTDVLSEVLDRFDGKPKFEQHREVMDAHLSKYFAEGEISVFHEMMSLDFHLDVYFIQPSKSEFNILITSGMSTMPMLVDEGLSNASSYRFAELMILLPKDVEFGKRVGVNTGGNDWIVDMLKQSARFPHHYDTFIAPAHTIVANADWESYASETKYCGVLVLPSMTFEEDFTKVKADDNVINIYSLFPLYRTELEYKIEHGYNKFIQFIIDDDTSEVAQLKRNKFI